MKKAGWEMYLFHLQYRGGKKRKVEVYAPNPEAARKGTGAMEDETIIAKKLSPLDKRFRAMTQSGRVKAKDRASFYETLQGFAESGASLERAVAVAAYGANSPYLRGAIGVIWQRLAREGAQPSEAFGEFKDIFGAMAIAMIKAAEASGEFAGVFRDLARWESQQDALKGRIIGALIYPAILVVLLLIGGYVVTFSVLPQIRVNYAAVGAEVPVAFEPFVRAAEIVVANPVLAALPIVAIVAAFFLAPRIWASRWFQKLLSRMAVLGKFMRQSILVKYLRILTLLMQRGVSVVDSYRMAEESTENHEFRRYFRSIRAIVESGEDPYVAFLRERDKVPGTEATVLAQKIYTSSFAGNTDKVLVNLAQAMDEDLLVKAENLPKAINPISGVIIMVGVAFLAFVSYFPQLWLVVEALRNN
jgi:type IV pilus assembly protein PilC